MITHAYKVAYDGAEYSSMSDMARSLGVTISALSQALRRSGKFRGKDMVITKAGPSGTPRRKKVVHDFGERPEYPAANDNTPISRMYVHERKGLIPGSVKHGLGLVGRS